MSDEVKVAINITHRQINHIESAIAFCLYCKMIDFDNEDLIEMQELEKKFKNLRELGLLNEQ